MLRWKKNEVTDEQLDRFSHEIFEALQVNETEVNNTAQSPFLYRRLCVRIEAEARRRAEANNPWQVWLMAVRHAIPAMAILAIVAVGSFWMLHETDMETTDNEVAISLLSDGSASVSDDDLVEVIGWQSGQSK
jgi:hypothetical protein